MDRLGDSVVRAPVLIAGDAGSNAGPGENFSLKLLKKKMIKYRSIS